MRHPPPQHSPSPGGHWQMERGGERRLKVNMTWPLRACRKKDVGVTIGAEGVKRTKEGRGSISELYQIKSPGLLSQ